MQDSSKQAQYRMEKATLCQKLLLVLASPMFDFFAAATVSVWGKGISIDPSSTWCAPVGVPPVFPSVCRMRRRIPSWLCSFANMLGIAMVLSA